jgi:hypothetical protein
MLPPVPQQSLIFFLIPKLPIQNQRRADSATELVQLIRSSVHLQPSISYLLHPIPSHMLYSTNDLTPYFSPVDALVKLLIDQSTYGNVVSSDEIEAMTRFGAWLWVVLRSNDPLDSIVEDDVR